MLVPKNKSLRGPVYYVPWLDERVGPTMHYMGRFIGIRSTKWQRRRLIRLGATCPPYVIRVIPKLPAPR